MRFLLCDLSICIALMYPRLKRIKIGIKVGIISTVIIFLQDFYITKQIAGQMFRQRNRVVNVHAHLLLHISCP